MREALEQFVTNRSPEPAEQDQDDDSEQEAQPEIDYGAALAEAFDRPATRQRIATGEPQGGGVSNPELRRTRTHDAIVDDQAAEPATQAAPVRDEDRRDQWIARYLAKYGPIAPDLSADFLRRNVMVEFAAERAFAVIEREEEFSTRPTRWVFEPGG